MESVQDVTLRTESYPPTLGCEEWVIPVLLRATEDAICDKPLRAINTNRRVGGFGGVTHNLAHTLAGVSNADLNKPALPAVSLPEEKFSDSNNEDGHCETGESHSPTLGQGGNETAHQ